MDLIKLRRIYLLALGIVISLAAIPLLLVGGSDGFPFLRTLLVVVTGSATVILIGWLRQRHTSNAEAAYAHNLQQMGLATVPTVLGFLIAITQGPQWLALVGAVPAFAGLLLAKPVGPDSQLSPSHKSPEPSDT